MRRLLPAPLALLLLAACGGGGEEVGAAAPPAEPPRNVRVLELARGTVDETVPVSGPLRPSREADLAAEESGVVEAVVAPKGARVEAGEPVLKLNRSLLAAELKSAEAMLLLRQKDEERTRALFEEQRASAQEMLGAHTQLEQAEAAASAARERLRRAWTRSPFAGVVTEIHVERGEAVTAGMPVARVIDPYELELEGHVSEREATWLREGAPALVEATGLATPVAGELRWISAEASPGTGKFGVEITVPNPGLQLRAGIIARATVLKVRHENVLAIPRDAVVREEGEEFVFVVRDGRAVLKAVRLGPGADNLVLVRDGLAEGDRLVVRGQRELRDGIAVEVTERATAVDGSVAGEAAALGAARQGS